MTDRPAIHTQCESSDDGWRCVVVVGGDPGATRHHVTVTSEEFNRLAPDGVPVERLLELSFEFLLEREPRESILRTFELSAIGRYFPEYDSTIRSRPAR